MINVIASVKIKESHMSEFIEIFKANMANVLLETGCIEYVPTLDFATGLPVQELNSNVITIIEKWETLESLQAHLIAPHMLEYKEKVRDIVESVSLKVLEKV
jgi:quinol monooxygenase YgiN